MGGHRLDLSRDTWQAFVNSVMNLGYHKMWMIYRLCQDILAARGLCYMRFTLRTSQINLKSNCTCKNYTGVTNIRTTDTGPHNLWIFPGQLNGSTVEHSTIKGPQHTSHKEHNLQRTYNLIGLIPLWDNILMVKCIKCNILLYILQLLQWINYLIMIRISTMKTYG